MFYNTSVVLSHLTRQHAALRSTFHTSLDSGESYAAIHDADTAMPAVEILSDDDDLDRALYQGFNLFQEYPVRWIISENASVSAGVAFTLFVIGHHIAVDGVRNLPLILQLGF